MSVKQQRARARTTRLDHDTANPGWLDPSLVPFTSRFVEIDGNLVHYYDEGNGPALLMLHGNPSWSFLYRHLIRDLATSFRCIALDYPGFGLSKAAPGYGFTPSEHSRVVESFVGALGLSDLSIMVQDWGGPIGLGFAERRPDLVRSLVIGNSFAWPASRSRGLTSFSRVVGSKLGRWLILRYNLLARWLIPAGINRKLTGCELAAYFGPLSTPSSRLATWTLARQIRLSEKFLREVEAGLVKLSGKPALIVWGDADGAFRKSDLERFAALFPKHRVVNLPGAKHFIQENAPGQISKAILDWTATLP